MFFYPLFKTLIVFALTIHAHFDKSLTFLFVDNFLLSELLHFMNQYVRATLRTREQNSIPLIRLLSIVFFFTFKEQTNAIDCIVSSGSLVNSVVFPLDLDVCCKI